MKNIMLADKQSGGIVSEIEGMLGKLSVYKDLAIKSIEKEIKCCEEQIAGGRRV